MNNRKFPIGVQNFEKIRKGDFLYVDKTELIYQLVDSRGFGVAGWWLVGGSGYDES